MCSPSCTIRATPAPMCTGAPATAANQRGGSVATSLPQEQWHTLLRDAHPGYISWEQYQDNQRQLHQNEQVRGVDHRSPAREGPALLQGLALCGLCGDPMRVRYHTYRGRRIPDYECYRHTPQRGEPPCQVIYG